MNESPTAITQEHYEIQSRSESHSLVKTDENSGKFLRFKFLRHFESDRLEAFCDAVLAIIATILVTPLKLTEDEINSEHTLAYHLTRPHESLDLPIIVVNVAFFILVYLIISQAWFYHVKIFILFPIADNFVLFLNLFFLIGASFLPPTTTLLEFAIIPEIVGLLLLSTGTIGLTQALQITYGYYYRKLFPHFDTKLSTILYLLFSVLLTPAYVLIVFLFSLLNNSLGAWLAGATLIIGNLANIFFSLASRVFHFYTTIKGKQVTFLAQIYELNKTIPKSRLEFFTDAVYSIVCTLVILDTTTSIQNCLYSCQYSLDMSLTEKTREIFYASRFSFYSFVISFLIICLFWYIHHSMFNLVRIVSLPVSFFNHLSLIMLCLIPFCSNILVGYSSENKVEHPRRNLDLALQITSVVIFFIGFFQLIMWLLIRFSKVYSYQYRSEYTGNIQMLFRILLLPVISLIVLFIVSTLTSGRLTLFSLFILVLSLPFILVLIESLHWLYFLVLNRRKVKRITHL